ncbi:alpha/beta fold hydrolase [Stackebrandtia nassauensis]|uniref:Alpha/beta hydrolase fold protein n=1 Tax=Stackebrandtia nassauensis (strain DSM 44728 / CIP 108903 / NRRL B-16338 / NBRC 102104 / LLR-40K-21) TaxID=446470 RepID=D3PUT1_STANL|nr:alpha/beta fold hydrolase [Stackebrandtia nassauensis]ADD44955.1 alpha/beta hydrolase fold protein [Stackebrandtia nassauensis DSM 44728]
MADSHFTHDNATIAYELKGSGRPVAYSHGVPLSRAAVRGLDLFDFDALAKQHRLLTYDHRGHGQSTGRPVTEDYRFENFAADFLALLDELGIDEPLDFTGSSLGADTVLRTAITAPHRLRRLVLMIPPVAWDEVADQAKQWYFDTADIIENNGAAAWRKEAANAAPPPIFADYPKFRFTPDVSDALLPSVLRGVGSSDLPEPEAIAGIQHPVLILAWDTDPLHPVATAEKLRELLPHSTLHVSTTVADVKTWTDRITGFLAE